MIRFIAETISSAPDIMAIFKSPRARAAREAGKRSSVEVARKLGLKTALEVDCLVEDIQPSQEWHHVGWKPRFGEPKRTYMFDADDIDRLLQKIAADPGALDRARERAIAKLENKALTKKMADTDKIVFYEEVVRVTPKAILFKIKGRETWIGKYMIRSHNPREKTLVISAKVALEKNIEGYHEKRKPVPAGSVWVAQAKVFDKNGTLIGYCMDTPNAIAKMFMEVKKAASVKTFLEEYKTKSEYKDRMESWNVAKSFFVSTK